MVKVSITLNLRIKSKIVGQSSCLVERDSTASCLVKQYGGTRNKESPSTKTMAYLIPCGPWYQVGHDKNETEFSRFFLRRTLPGF